jgi:hypothetical protein|nr:MAG TPA: endonuclease [Caudoviricetes sp.]
MYFNEKHKQRVISRGDNYTYICSYKCNEITIDGKCLKKGKQTYIKVKCPYCGKKYYVSLINFTKKKVKCTYCCNSYEKSFAYHIQQELGESLNKYWDWNKNIINPYCINKNSNKKVWIKCTKTNYHESTLMTPAHFVRGDRCPYCSTRRGKVHPKDSFAQWAIDNVDKDFLTKYWSDKNILNPWKLTPQSRNKIYIYCQEKDYHNDEGGYEITCENFYKGIRCGYCGNHRVHPKDSFAQWGIDTFGDDFLEKYWSSKNTIDPWRITPQSNKRNIYMLCQEYDYHNDFDGYLTSPANFKQGNRCPYCTNQKVHPKDSFGALYPSKAKYWSPNNKKSPYEVAPKSGSKYKFICQDCGKEFKRSLASLNHFNTGVYCQDCNNSQLEEITKQILQKHNITYTREVKFDKLLGLGGKYLSYDFYLPNFNLLLELQGIQHKEFRPGLHKTYADFERQLEHDRRKKQYSIDHNINFLEIWYYDIDNIEQILTKQLNL